MYQVRVLCTLDSLVSQSPVLCRPDPSLSSALYSILSYRILIPDGESFGTREGKETLIDPTI